jgi:ankyrin repeat protein
MRLLADQSELNAKDNYDNTPLHFAAEDGTYELVELHLNKNVEVNGRNKGGWTPLSAAIHYGHTRAADLLRQHGGQE